MKLHAWKQRKQQQAGPRDGELRVPTAAESSTGQDEAPASLEQHIRPSHTQRHETLYGTIKAMDEDRPECDPETSYMNMQLSWREQDYTRWSKSGASGHRNGMEQAELPWLNNVDGSLGGQCLYLSVEKERVYSPVPNISVLPMLTT